MSYASVRSCTMVGVEPLAVTVEVHVSPGLPGTHIVGLPQSSVRESKDRVRAAILHSGFEYPQVRVVVNLAPADVPKQGGRFDLPIALAVLVAHGQLKPTCVENVVCLGELGLTGEVRRVGGVLPTAAAFTGQNQRLLIPVANQQEARLSGLRSSLAVTSLRHATEVLSPASARGAVKGRRGAAPAGGGTRHDPVDESASPDPAPGPDDLPDLSDVRGQLPARRVLEIAAAGGHHLLLSGSPGTGKSMLAQRLPGILPPMTRREALEAASVASVTHAGFDQRQWAVRPFRAPHHTCSGVALVGGGARPVPGEISLAHHGVLFLDELTEFPRAVLDVLRQPLESGWISVSRAASQAQFPARFQFVGAMNPCPCGHAGDLKTPCRCTPDQVLRYQARLSGPLLDRIDLRISLIRPDGALLEPVSNAEPSESVRMRVCAARQRQIDRQDCINAQIEPHRLLKIAVIGNLERKWLATACERLGLSARAAHRVLRVARTLADLEARPRIEQEHLAEALSYRGPASPGVHNLSSASHTGLQGAIIGR